MHYGTISTMNAENTQANFGSFICGTSTVKYKNMFFRKDLCQPLDGGFLWREREGNGTGQGNKGDHNFLRKVLFDKGKPSEETLTVFFLMKNSTVRKGKTQGQAQDTGSQEPAGEGCPTQAQRPRAGGMPPSLSPRRPQQSPVSRPGPRKAPQPAEGGLPVLVRTARGPSTATWTFNLPNRKGEVSRVTFTGPCQKAAIDSPCQQEVFGLHTSDIWVKPS